ncbi:lipoyl(octanoyl) transferase LipB [Thiomicrorhabdus sp.]|uniref:lipoyl(octanoyl) transferase LipB n=1 Tax=Thiomicrorhabdus sp. TaxID=2039724 RepID=UPI0029C6B204|nr:lipoyl(octanoyl) transferase LipB [Thiomicrorhabdus sp.]
MSIQITSLGLQPYEQTWQAMQEYTSARDENSKDRIWIVEHPAVYTQGLNGKSEHLLHPDPSIPVVQTDRGGQITYHGPGQIVLYALIDLKRARLGVRELVSLLEEAIIQFLQSQNISALADPQAPGVYVSGRKIASLGLKIRKQKSYHGLAFNLNMDLTPFAAINPCGLINMQMVQLKDLIPADSLPSFEKASKQLAETLAKLIRQRIEQNKNRLQSAEQQVALQEDAPSK